MHAVHPDVPFTRSMTATVRAELEALAGWLDLAETGFARTAVA